MKTDGGSTRAVEKTRAGSTERANERDSQREFSGGNGIGRREIETEGTTDTDKEREGEYVEGGSATMFAEQRGR